MIDYARPFDPNMCEFLLTPTPPAPTRLEDFQVFRKNNPNYIYANYYHNYDMYTEPEMDTTAIVYHDLTTRENRHEEWRYKAVIDWTPDDTTYWLIDCAMTQGFSEYEVPFYNFKISGVDLRHMRPEEFFQRMVHPSVDTNLSRRIADVVYDKLHARINEEMLRQTPLFRYGDSDYQAHEPVQTMLDLDSLDHKNRLYASDYKPNDSSLLQTADSSDEADDGLCLSDTASPECSYGSEGSKSGDEDKKRFKRPPGRPKGTGRKVCKRPRSVSVPEFLRNLLLDKNYCPSIIKWEDHLQGKFRFVKPDEVAKLWGHLKQNDNMTFEKFSRAMRYHYRQSVLVSVPTARLVYQFGPKGPNFKTENPNFVKVKSEVHDITYSNS